MENQQVKEHLSNSGQWIRILYMLLFTVILYFVLGIVGLVILVQLVLTLLTGSSNENIKNFSNKLARYIHQIILFLSYNEEEKPYPFSDWQN